jgi:hypothetical protein
MRCYAGRKKFEFDGLLDKKVAVDNVAPRFLITLIVSVVGLRLLNAYGLPQAC